MMNLMCRYIEIYRACANDFLSVSTGTSGEATEFLAKPGDFILRMRGLPYTATIEDIVEFFEKSPNPAKIVGGVEGVLFVRSSNGRATGDAFVRFSSYEEGQTALLRHKELIGTRYIEVFER